jgi:hypothetical protein
MNVFIFASNSSGFHGAGSAGFAFRGTSANTWRNCPIMNAARSGGERQGVYAVYGVSRGFQTGKKGSSYAIETVTKPGAKRSIPISDIAMQVVGLIGYIRENPTWTFCLTKIGAGYAGYTEAEMQPLWDSMLAEPNCRWAKNEAAST